MARYHAPSVSEQNPAPSPPEAPIDPLFSHAASPFMRTETPPQVGFPFPPPPMVTTWITYKTQIQFGFAILAYLMILVGSVTVVQANPEASWKYFVVVLPVILFAFAAQRHLVAGLSSGAVKG